MRCHQSPTICHSHNNAICQVQVTTVEKSLLKFHMFHELIIHAQTQHPNKHPKSKGEKKEKRKLVYILFLLRDSTVLVDKVQHLPVPDQ